jgi:hypothetical protein
MTTTALLVGGFFLVYLVLNASPAGARHVISLWHDRNDPKTVELKDDPLRATKRRQLCRGRYIYVLPLPALFNTALCGTIAFDGRPSFCVDGEFPRHRLVNSTTPLYGTESFDLFNILNQRFLHHPCRTWDASEATLVWVPIAYGILCSALFEPNEFQRNQYISRFRRAYETFFQLGKELMRTAGNEVESLKPGGVFQDNLLAEVGRLSRQTNLSSLPNSTAWNRCYGCNFVMLNHKVQSDCRWFAQRGMSKEILADFEANKLICSIEADPHNPKPSWSIPYPGHLHVNSTIELQQWQGFVRNIKRPKLMTYIAGWRPHRQTIIEDCRSARGCEYVGCGKRCGGPKLLHHMLESQFCLQTKGDTASRQGFFDSIEMGCFPTLVTSDKDDLLNFYQSQYFQDSVDLKRFVIVGSDVASILSQVQSLTVMDLRRMQDYMLDHVLPRISYSTASIERTDAFEVLLQRLFEEVRVRIGDGREISSYS